MALKYVVRIVSKVVFPQEVNVHTINDFIMANYTVSFFGCDVDQNDLSTADEYLVANARYLPDTINSEFVNTFATEKDVVLLPRVNSGLFKTNAKIEPCDKHTILEITGSEIFQKYTDLIESIRTLFRKALLESCYDDAFVETNAERREFCLKHRDELGCVFDPAVLVPARIDSLNKARSHFAKTFLMLSDTEIKLFPEEFLKSRKVVVLLPNEQHENKMKRKQADKFAQIEQKHDLGV